MKIKSLILILFIMLSYYLPAAQNKQESKLDIQPITFKPKKGAPVQAERCTFYVPENRRKKTSKQLKLGFIRFKSTNPNPGYPIVYLAGGPGGSGSGAAKGRRFSLFMALREVADVIAFDQRGAGLSNQAPYAPVKLNYPLTTPFRREPLLQAMKQKVRESVKFWKSKGIDIDAYNTNESADDLDALRKVLNVDKINLWGISYGSHLAFAMIKRHPQRIHRVILASLEGPDHTVKLPALSQAHLERVNAILKQNPESAKKYPDLLPTIKKVLDQLEVSPVMMDVTNPDTGKKVKIGFGKMEIQLLTVFWMVKNPRELSTLPYLYYRMAERDFSQLGVFILFLKNVMSRTTLMSLAMDAASGISPERRALVQAQAPKAFMGDAHDFPYPEIIEAVGIKDLGEEFRKPFKTNIPALLYSGTLDGRTFLEAQTEIASWFEKGTHVIIDNAGHDLFFSSPKIKEQMIDFLEGKAVTETRLTGPPLKFM
jgi:pimeloyl-ACP methyl ester carboxylesterase